MRSAEIFYDTILAGKLVETNDMHLKNFSMIESAPGWILSPAYDLLNVAIADPEDKEELALTLCGKKKKLTKEHFVNFGEDLGLSYKQIDRVFIRFQKNKSKMIQNSFLSQKMELAYIKVLEERFIRLHS